VSLQRMDVRMGGTVGYVDALNAQEGSPAVARLIGAAPLSVRRWAENGLIPGAYQLPNGKWQIPLVGVVEMVRNATPEPARSHVDASMWGVDEFLTVKAAGERVGASAMSVRRWAKLGLIHGAYKLPGGSRWWVPWSGVQMMVRESTPERARALLDDVTLVRGADFASPADETADDWVQSLLDAGVELTVGAGTLSGEVDSSVPADEPHGRQVVGDLARTGADSPANEFDFWSMDLGGEP